MKDLDFDELDRAVNSVISGKGVPAPRPVAPVVEPVDAAPAQREEAPVPVTVRTMPPVAMSSPEATETPVVVEQQPVMQAQPLAARRSSGRFMDVVHPSSDMRTASTPAPVSRKGIDISPVSAGVVAPVEPPEVIEAPQPFSWSEESRSLAETDQSDDDAHQWPDPLDMPDFSYTAPDEPVPADVAPAPIQDAPMQPQIETDEDDDINQIANAPAAASDQTLAPQESPFLSDAIIQKRPLGAFTVEPVVAAAPASPVVESSAAAAAPTTTDVLSRFDEPVRFTTPTSSEDHDAQLPVAVDEPLPAELQNEVLSLESTLDDTRGTTKPDIATQKEAFAQNFTGSTSISQQYSEQPSTGDQHTGAIYDTEAYHKPLAHPLRKKSGWMVIVWILLLLIVGAGAGAAVYFFVLPLL